MHDVHEKAIALGGMSKTYGCPGLRIGWLATHASAALKSIEIAKDYTSICCCAPGMPWLRMPINLSFLCYNRKAEVEQEPTG